MAYQFHNNLPDPFHTRSPGIYAIVNRNNTKIYIGSAASLSHRWTTHRHDFFRNRQNPYLMRAFRKEPEAFYFELVEELPGASKERRLEREQFWLDFYRSYEPQNGYNACREARSCEGVKHGPEYSAMLSARKIKWSEETKARVRLNRKPRPTGWHHSEETKKKCALGRLGKPWTADQKEKNRKWWAEHPELNRCPVFQMSMSGDIIRRFNSIMDAEKSFGGKRSNIHQVCKGRKPHCLGFKWKYA